MSQQPKLEEQLRTVFARVARRMDTTPPPWAVVREAQPEPSRKRRRLAWVWRARVSSVTAIVTALVSIAIGAGALALLHGHSRDSARSSPTRLRRLLAPNRCCTRSGSSAGPQRASDLDRTLETPLQPTKSERSDGRGASHAADPPRSHTLLRPGLPDSAFTANGSIRRSGRASFSTPSTPELTPELGLSGPALRLPSHTVWGWRLVLRDRQIDPALHRRFVGRRQQGRQWSARSPRWGSEGRCAHRDHHIKVRVHDNIAAFNDGGGSIRSKT